MTKNNGNYSENNIVDGLKAVGIKEGDSIFIHSNLGFFGLLENAKKPIDYYEAFKTAIFDIIGPTGTLIVPTFSYSFCNNEDFNIELTKSVCGVFSEFVRNDKESFRSMDANFSVAAIGYKAKYYTENADEYSFGSSSFWSRFLKERGKICNFNFDSGSTFIHFVEREIAVEYRYDKPFYGKIIDHQQEKDAVFYHFVYDLSKPEDKACFTNFDKLAKKLGLSKIANLGKGQIISISAKDTFNLIEKEIIKNNAFLREGIKRII